MRLLFDGYSLTRKEIYGIHRNALQMLHALDNIAAEESIELAIPRCSEERLVTERLSFKNIRLAHIGKKKKKASKLGKIVDEALWREFTFPYYARKKDAIKIDLLLDFANTKMDAVTIYDCIPELFPYVNPPLKYRLRIQAVKYLQQRGIKNSKVVLTTSEYSKQDIQKVYRLYGKEIKVIPCGWQHFEIIQEDREILNKLRLEEKGYFFSLGSRMPHKNIRWVSAAAQKHPQYTFVVTGALQGWTDTSFEGKIPDNLIFTGYLRDEEIKTLMRYCIAFIQPSLYEGFGIPPMEAMSVGADCIVSNATSLPEIYKDSVWYIDPYDYEHIDLDEIMSKPKERNDLILNKYSWEKSAKKLLEVLNDLEQKN